MLEKHGLRLLAVNTVKKIHSSPSLYELRITGSTQVRLLLMQYDKQTFLILHGFVKKSNKLPEKHYKLALRRTKEYI
ncbi:MAG: type II toxin-antitoxin system RelE/ParE family toxin [bacterium]|nr:type II toxin-antitoxin system RelE/ParE family toxin [bacterium]